MSSGAEGDQPRAALRVLIVEDNETDYELIVRTLDRAGFDVTATRVEDDAAALRAVQSTPFDVVVSDHTLPRSSGWEVVRVVQNEQPFLPVLIVTGSIDEETAADYIKAGAADYIVKHRLQRLAPAVRRALALRDAVREAIDAEAAREATEVRFRS